MAFERVLRAIATTYSSEISWSFRETFTVHARSHYSCVLEHINALECVFNPICQHIEVSLLCSVILSKDIFTYKYMAPKMQVVRPPKCRSLGNWFSLISQLESLTWKNSIYLLKDYYVLSIEIPHYTKLSWGKKKL